MRIGVFDSGVGGLTVLKNLIKRYPNHEYIYYGDTLNAPYGNKSLSELENLSSKIVEFLIKKNVHLIVIACGTISSTLSDTLRRKYNTNIIDIITPTIKYINNSDYKKIGVLATQTTINSKVFLNNINKPVSGVAAVNFVPIIESRNYNELNTYIPLYLKSLLDCDLIILGCTHYPIIKKYIENYIQNTELLDMSECISINETYTCMQKINLYFSKLDNNVLNNIKNILNIDDLIIKK